MDVEQVADESPAGFQLFPPEVYVPLDLEVGLEGDELRAAAARLVDERATVDWLVAHRRDEWVDYVARVWRDALEEQALDAWTMVYDAEGLPVEAMLLAFEGDREHPHDIDAEIRSLQAALAVVGEGDMSEPDVSVVELPAGPAVRVRNLVEVDPGKRRSRVVDMVEYWVPVPGRPRCLLLNFTTPVLVLADILAEIADAIAQSLRFRP